MNFSTYPAYRDSGVEWLGKTPQHWSVYSLKRTVDGCVNGLWGDEPDGENDIAVIRVADFQRSSSTVGLDKLTYRSITTKERKSRLIKSGDLLIEKSGGGEKTLVGCVVLFAHEFDAITSNFVAKMRPLADFDSQFLCYAFGKLYDSRVNYPSVKQVTGIQNLDAESYLQERFCFPTRAEQTHIARFLDHETARIDALIEEQQRLIELLKEKRQAVISQVVTKGLDSSVPTKDSGVQWLGEVPAHWSVTRSKFVFGLLSGYAFKSEFFQKNGDGEKTLITPGSFDELGKLYFSEKSTVQYVGEWHSQFELKAGDLVMVLTDLSYKKLILGRAAFVDRDDALLNQRIARVISSPHVEDKYLWLAINSEVMREQLKLTASGATVFHTSTEKVGDCWMALPPEDEQLVITAFVEKFHFELDELIKQVIDAVGLLHERRSALISAAVTGKIDVRGWKPPTKALSRELAEEAV